MIKRFHVAVIALALLATSQTFAAEKPALTATLKSNKESYAIDPKIAIESKRHPAKVDLTLTIANNSDKEIKFNLGGDESMLNFTLKGKDAVTFNPDIAMTEEYRAGKPATIAPGKTFDIPITSLAGGQRGMTELSYFADAGDYELSVTFTTNANNANLKLTTDPITIKVVKAEK